MRALGTALSSCVVVAALAGACGDDSGPGGGGATSSTTTGAGGEATTSTGASSATGLPETFEVTGVVVDQVGAPVPDAIVMQGGSTPTLVTGADGAFSITLATALSAEPVVVAAKIGYRTDGLAFEEVPTEAVTLVLHEVKQPDNALGYFFGHPGVGDPAVDNNTSYCGHCHTTFAREFNQSAHARAAKNPKVHDLYAGVATALADPGACAQVGGAQRTGQTPGNVSASQAKCYVGDGVLPDLNACGGAQACDDPALPAPQKPTSFGACADCHGFGMDGISGGRNLLDAEGVGFEFGVHCDACHHVRDVDLAAPPGGGGRLVMQRPREKIGDEISGPIRQAMFGPYPDVPNPFMGGSYQPKFSTAEFCAGCHQQYQGALMPGASLDPLRFPEGLPTHDTFSEWSEGAWGNAETPCQHCHMPSRSGLTNSVDVTTPDDTGIAFGFERDPEQLRSHSFRGPLTKIDGAWPRLLDGAVAVSLSASPVAGQLEVSVSLTNLGCGHAVPTGEPMRALVLVVEASGCGQALRASGGQTIDDVGGVLLQATFGAAATPTAQGLLWPAAAQGGYVGKRIRIVRPTAMFLDYDGVGLFELGVLPAAQKGTELLLPVAEAVITGVAGDEVLLDQPPAGQAGDLVLIGDAVPQAFLDGDPARFLAGMSGATYSKVLKDPSGARRVPHYRAVDIASDNRIRPFVTATSAHTFTIPGGCASADVKATLLYRPHPADLARERGWDARDYVAGLAATTVPL